MRFTKGFIPWNKGNHIYTGGKKFEKGMIPWNKQEVVLKKCLTCGKEFTDNPARMKKKETKYCSSKCSGKARRGTKLTEEHKKKIGVAGKGRQNTLGKHWKYPYKRIWSKENIKKFLRRRKKSSLEIKTQEIIDKYNLPYKFVGNGDFFIERKNPDFININGEKIAFEVYSKKHKDLFRGGAEIWKKDRERIFNEYGWTLLFFDGTQVNEQYMLKILTK